MVRKGQISVRLSLVQDIGASECGATFTKGGTN